MNGNQLFKNIYILPVLKRKKKTDKETQNTDHNFLSVLLNVINFFFYFIRLSNRVFVRKDEIFTLTVFNILQAKINTMNYV